MANEVKTRQVQPEKSLESLFEAANRDPALKKRLLANPKAVAGEWKVELSDQDVEQLTKLGVIVELADDVKFGRLYPKIGPIFYPISVWKVREVVDIIGNLIPHVSYRGPVSYRGQFGNFHIPRPIFYPADDGSGAGGRWGGVSSWGTVVNPGVIFYPAQLLTRIEENLVVKLRTTAKIKE